MPSFTYEALIKDIRNRKFHPVYLLHGEEPYYIDLIDEAIEKGVLDEAEKGFNQSIVYGRDCNIATVLSMAKRYPMMSEYQVVMVREAQDMKDLFKKKRGAGDDDDDTEGEEKSKPGDKDLMAEYLKKPLPSTVLVFCYKHKPVDKRTKLYKEFEKAAACLETKKLYDNQIPSFITSYVSNRGYKISEPSAILITEYLGADLTKVSNELDKLMLNLPAGKEISGELIESGIGISKEFNVFELQSSIAKKDIVKANRIVNYFGANPKSNPIVVTLGTLNTFFNKIITYHAMRNKPGVNLATALKVHPFFMKEYDLAARNYSQDACIRIMGWLHEFDMKSKGVGNRTIGHHDLLRELVFRILHHNVVPV